MSIYYDQRETRDPEQRETSLMAALPALIQRAKTAPGWARILRVSGADNHRSCDQASD